MTDSTPLVEKVARAICEAHWPPSSEASADDTLEDGTPRWTAYLPEARAALDTSGNDERNPCAGIFDHKWLDPQCVAKGCQSLFVKYQPLHIDDAETELWSAIEAIKIGNKTDDKLILANLAKRGILLCRSTDAIALTQEPEQ